MHVKIFVSCTSVLKLQLSVTALQQITWTDVYLPALWMENGLTFCPYEYPDLSSCNFTVQYVSQDSLLTGLDHGFWKLPCSQATGLFDDGKLLLHDVIYGAKTLLSRFMSYLEAHNFFPQMIFCVSKRPSIS